MYTIPTSSKQFIIGDQDDQILIAIWDKAPKLNRPDEDTSYSTIIDYDISKKEMMVFHQISDSCSSTHSESALFYDKEGEEALITGDSHGTKVWFIHQNLEIELPSIAESDADTRFVRLADIQKFEGGFDILYKGMSIMGDNKQLQMVKRVLVDRLFSDDDSNSDSNSDPNGELDTDFLEIIEFPFMDQGRPQWDRIMLPVVLNADMNNISPFDLSSYTHDVQRESGEMVRFIATYNDQNLDYRFVDSKKISSPNGFGQLDVYEMIDNQTWTYNIRTFAAKIVDMSDDESSYTGQVLIFFHTFNIYASAENHIMVKLPINQGLKCSGVSVAPGDDDNDRILFELEDIPFLGQTIDISRIIEAAEFNTQVVRVMRGVWINGEHMEVNVWPDTLDLDSFEDQNSLNEADQRDQKSSIDKVFGNYYPKNQILHVTYEDGNFFKTSHTVSYKCQMFKDSLICLVDEPIHKTDRESYSRDKSVLSPEWNSIFEQLEAKSDTSNKYSHVMKRIILMADRRDMCISDVVTINTIETIKKHLDDSTPSMKKLLTIAEDLRFNKVLYAFQDENRDLSQNAVHQIESNFLEAQFNPVECRIFYADTDMVEVVNLQELVARPLTSFKKAHLLETFYPSRPIGMSKIPKKHKYVINIWDSEIETRSGYHQEFLDASDKKARIESGLKSMHVFTNDSVGWIWDEDQSKRCPDNQSFNGHYLEIPENVSTRVKSLVFIIGDIRTKVILKTREGDTFTLPLDLHYYTPEILDEARLHFKDPRELESREVDDYTFWKIESLKCGDNGLEIEFKDRYDRILDDSESEKGKTYVCIHDVDELLDEAIRYEQRQ